MVTPCVSFMLRHVRPSCYAMCVLHVTPCASFLLRRVCPSCYAVCVKITILFFSRWEQGATWGQHDLDIWFLGEIFFFELYSLRLQTIFVGIAYWKSWGSLSLSCFSLHIIWLFSGWNSRSAFCNNLQSRRAKPRPDGRLRCGQPQNQKSESENIVICLGVVNPSVRLSCLPLWCVLRSLGQDQVWSDSFGAKKV